MLAVLKFRESDRSGQNGSRRPPERCNVSGRRYGAGVIGHSEEVASFTNGETRLVYARYRNALPSAPLYYLEDDTVTNEVRAFARQQLICVVPGCLQRDSQPRTVTTSATGSFTAERMSQLATPPSPSTTYKAKPPSWRGLLASTPSSTPALR